MILWIMEHTPEMCIRFAHKLDVDDIDLKMHRAMKAT